MVTRVTSSPLCEGEKISPLPLFLSPHLSLSLSPSLLHTTTQNRTCTIGGTRADTEKPLCSLSLFLSPLSLSLLFLSHRRRDMSRSSVVGELPTEQNSAKIISQPWTVSAISRIRDWRRKYWLSEKKMFCSSFPIKAKRLKLVSWKKIYCSLKIFDCHQNQENTSGNNSR